MDTETANRYSKIMDEIIERTNGEFENMTLEDKLLTIHIMREIDKQMTEYIAHQLPIVKAWASLDISDVILSETECYLDDIDMCLSL